MSETDGGSAWLFKPPPGTPSRLPPPLLQCLPSASSPPAAIVSTRPGASDDIEPTPPPSKRNRKSKPHKLVCESLQDETELITFEDEQLQDSLDGHRSEVSEKLNMDDVEENITGGDIDSHGGDTLYLDNINQPFFPSFQPCKVEPSLPITSRHSPTGMSKKSLPPCTVCGRCFPTKEKMADHMRSHSEIKQFSCLVCNRFFKYRRGVTNHLKEVHHMTDRIEISSKVASHEIGCIVPRRKGSTKGGKKSNKDDAVDSSISEKVIQATLSSLADIQQTADSATIPLQISSDESVSMTDADDSAFIVDEQSSPNENAPHDEREAISDETSFQDNAIELGPTTAAAYSQAVSRSQWPTESEDYMNYNYLPSSGATGEPGISGAGSTPVTSANKTLV